MQTPLLLNCNYVQRISLTEQEVMNNLKDNGTYKKNTEHFQSCKNYWLKIPIPLMLLKNVHFTMKTTYFIAIICGLLIFNYFIYVKIWASGRRVCQSFRCILLKVPPFALSCKHFSWNDETCLCNPCANTSYRECGVEKEDVQKIQRRLT